VVQIKLSAFYLTIICLLFSCRDPKKTNPTVGNESHKQIVFPFKFLKTRKSEVMDISLYVCGEKPNLDSLILFCRNKTEEITDKRWYEFVFFDSTSNAAFPIHDESAIYTEMKTLVHIKAQYHFCRALEATGRLTFASPNLLKGKWQLLEIK
jgi:ubiquitin